MKTPTQDFFLGAWHIRPQLNRIERDGVMEQVEPRVMRVLVCLAEARGEVVTRDALLDAVWGETIVTEDSLTRTIFDLRKVFKDKAQNPQVIETIRKVGYRLLVPVTYASGGGDSVALEDIVVTPRLAAPQPQAVVVAQPPQHRGGLYAGLGVAAVVLLGSVLWVLPTQSPELKLEHRPLTTFAGAEMGPALSPDGQQVAFVWNDGGENEDIYVKQVGTENPDRLTTHPDMDASPSWSPDGRRLAFMRTGEDGCSVYVMPVPGSGERQVADCQTTYQMPRSVAWSLDGEHILFADRVNEDAAFQLYAVSLKTLAVQLLTEPQSDYLGDVSPAFSPDGRQVAFVRALSASTVVPGLAPVFGHVYLASVKQASGDLALTQLRRISEEAHSILGIDWSQDGQSILYSTNQGTMNYGLWRLAAAGGQPEVVHRPMTLVRNPSVARNGSRMAYETWAATTNIWQVRPDPQGEGGWTHEPLIQSTRWDFAPNISPDGKRIAFVSTRTLWAELWVSDADGTNLHQLTTLEDLTVDVPRWSPQGDQIAFVHASNIYVIQANGGTPVQLTEGKAEDRVPSWSLDGQWIYFGSNRSGAWQIWRVPVAGGAVEQVTETGGYRAVEAVHEGTTWLIYCRLNSPTLSVRTLDGEKAYDIEATMPAPYWNRWDVADSLLYFMEVSKNASHIGRWDLGHMERLPVITGAMRDMGGFTHLQVVPESTTFLYTRLEQISGDLMLVENFQ